VSRDASIYSYRAFGLALASEIRLPELLPLPDHEAASPDITLRLGPLEAPESAKEHGRYTRVRDELVYLYWDRVGAFRIRGGEEIQADPLPGAGEDQLRLLVLGPALAVCLHQRGLLVLHGSAVRFSFEEEDAAVAFLGDSGSGKSTTASALQARGHGFITDDLTVLDPGANTLEISVHPGYPRCKLRPEAIEPLGLNAESLPLISPDLRRSQTIAEFEATPLPLRHVVSLSKGSPIEARRLSRKEAFFELSRYLYLAPFLVSEERAKRMGQLSEVARRIAVTRFTRPLEPQNLMARMDEIEAFLR
jgi:hypothetical protein